MRMTNNKRTLHDILRYIKWNHLGGKLQESVASIGEKTGYSNATVHRAIKMLEQKGVVTIQETSSQSEPNVILYTGNDNEELPSLVDKAEVAIANFQQASNELQVILNQLRQNVRLHDDSHNPLH